MSVGFILPDGACDCHVHVFGPADRFPMDPGRGYTPGPAPVEALAAHLDALALERVVVVQPSVYGTDNRCTLDAVARLGARARGIAVVDPAASSGEIATLARGGVRGLRLNLVAEGIAEPQAARERLLRAGDLAAGAGWHVQLFLRPDLIAALEADLAALPVPAVIDHFGFAPAAAGPGQEGFAALLGLIGSGNVWVKLSSAYQLSEEPDQADVAPLARALAAAGPERILWGSDWPHPGNGAPGPDGLTPFRVFDAAAALDRLAGWIGDRAVVKAMLVANPARLYGFADAGG